jgi:putative ABC transport system permease protein
MKRNKYYPPRIAVWILKHTARYEENFAIFGDFDEEYQDVVRSTGALAAWFWYWLQFLRSLPIFIKDSFYWSFIMLRNYLKIAFRSLKKHKGYSFINISGLAIGMAVCVLILMWILNELSYDRFHENTDRICRVTMDLEVGSTLHTPVTLTAAGPALVRDFPEVVHSSRILPPNRVAVKYEDKQFQESRVGFAENAVFDIFTFPFESTPV